MREYITRLPMHWIMVPVFFILHIVNEFYGLLYNTIVFSYLGYYLLLTVIVFFVGKLIYRSNKKSAVWTTVLMSIFLFWGVFHDFLKGFGMPRFFTSYTLLLPVLFFLVLFFTWIFRKRKDVNKITALLNIIFAVLIVIDLTLIAYKYLSPGDENDISRNNPPLNIDIKPVPDSLKPDIYFIVFDEYASSLSLKKYFNFDNHALDTMMENNRFYIAKKSRSNYNATPLSVSSTFNIQYFREKFEGVLTGAKILQQGFYTLNLSFIPKFLKANGYQVYHYGLDPDNTNLAPVKFSDKVCKKIFFIHTFPGRIERDILWNFKILLSSKEQLALWRRVSNSGVEKYRQEVMNNFHHLIDEMNKPFGKAKFVYAHMLLPHSPFILDRNGNIVDQSKKESQVSGGYIEQVLYTNKLIEQIVHLSTKSGGRPRVVIIEGDHGFRGDTPVPNTRETYFMNLSTFYFSDGDYRLLYDSISPVNTFRVVLNKYFKTNLPLLKDTTILINYK